MYQWLYLTWIKESEVYIVSKGFLWSNFTISSIVKKFSRRVPDSREEKVFLLPNGFQKLGMSLKYANTLSGLDSFWRYWEYLGHKLNIHIDQIKPNFFTYACIHVDINIIRDCQITWYFEGKSLHELKSWIMKIQLYGIGFVNKKDELQYSCPQAWAPKMM